MTLHMVAEHTATHAKRDDGRPTQELAGDDPKTRLDQASSRTRNNAGDVHVGKNDLDVGTEDQVNEFGSTSWIATASSSSRHLAWTAIDCILDRDGCSSHHGTQRYSEASSTSWTVAALGVIMAIILFSFRTAWIATATLSSRQTYFPFWSFSLACDKQRRRRGPKRLNSGEVLAHCYSHV